MARSLLRATPSRQASDPRLIVKTCGTPALRSLVGVACCWFVTQESGAISALDAQDKEIPTNCFS
jgi:hypothetical protein